MRKMIGIAAVVSAMGIGALAIAQQDDRQPQKPPQTGMVKGRADVDRAVAGWPAKARALAYVMMKKYGQPDEIGSAKLMWNDNGPWKRTVLSRDVTPHDFPKPHVDLLEHRGKTPDGLDGAVQLDALDAQPWRFGWADDQAIQAGTQGPGRDLQRLDLHRGAQGLGTLRLKARQQPARKPAADHDRPGQGQRSQRNGRPDRAAPGEGPPCVRPAAPGCRRRDRCRGG